MRAAAAVAQSAGMEPLEPQAALETAVTDLMRLSVASGGLGWAIIQCGRTFDGRPPPLARDPWYAAVWHDGSRQSGGMGAQTTALDEEYGLYVTVTVELNIDAFDQWVQRRDLLEKKCNRVVDLIHKDVYANAITNAANELAGFRRADLAAGATQEVGLFRGLTWQGTDSVVEAGAEWLSAQPTGDKYCAYQRVRFGGVARVRNLAFVGEE